MTDARALRIAGWNGVLFSILSLIVIPLTAGGSQELPALGATGEQFAAWYASHKTGFLLGNYLGIAAFIPGFVQLAILAAAIRAKDDPKGWFGAFVLATGTFTYTVFACSLVVFQVMPFLIDPASPHATLAMGTLAAIWFSLDGLAAVPMLLAVGWATLATGVFPRWFASLSWLVIAIAIVMSLGSIFDKPPWLAAGAQATLLGFFAFFAWTFVMSALMLRPNVPRAPGG